MSAERRLALATFGYRGGVGGEVTKEVYKYVQSSINTAVEIVEILVTPIIDSYDVSVSEETTSVSISVPSVDIEITVLDD